MSPTTGVKGSESRTSNCGCLVPEQPPANPCAKLQRPISCQLKMESPPKPDPSRDNREQDGHVQKRICQIRFWPPGVGSGVNIQNDYNTHKCVCEKPADERRSGSGGKSAASERNAFEERDNPNANGWTDWECVSVEKNTVELRDSPKWRGGDDGKHLADSKGRCCAAAEARKAADMKFPDGGRYANDRQVTPKESNVTLDKESKTESDLSCDNRGQDGHVQKRICQIRFWPPGVSSGVNIQNDDSTDKCVCEKPADERGSGSGGKSAASERNAFEERDNPKANGWTDWECVSVEKNTVELRDSPKRRGGDDGKHLADSKGRCCAAAEARKAADMKFPDGGRYANDRQVTPKESNVTLDKESKTEPPKKQELPKEDNSDLQCSGHRCRTRPEPIVQVAETYNSPMPPNGSATDTNWQRCGRNPLPHEEVWRADSYHSINQNPFTMGQTDPIGQNPDQDDSSQEQPNDMLVCTSSCVCLNNTSDSFVSSGGSYCVTIEQCDRGCTNEEKVNGDSSYLSIQNCAIKTPVLYSALTGMPNAPLEGVPSTSSQDNCVKPPEQYRPAIQNNCSKPQEVYRVLSEPNCTKLQSALSDCLSIITNTGPCICTAPKNEALEYKNLLLAALTDCLCASTHKGPCQCTAAKKEIKKDEDDNDQMVLPLKGSSEKLPNLDCQFSSLSSAPLQNTSSDSAPQKSNTNSQEAYHVASHEKSAKPRPASSPPNRAKLQSELSTLPLSTHDRHCSCSAARNVGIKRRDQTELCCAWQCNTEPSKLENATTCLDRALSSLNRAVAVLERKASPVHSDSISSYSSSCSDCKPSRKPSIPPGLDHVPSYEDTPCHKPDTHHEFGPRSIHIAPCCDIFNMHPQLNKKPEESEVYEPAACHTCSCRQSRKKQEDPMHPQSDLELDGRKWVKFSMQDLTHTYTANECDNDYMNWLDNMEQ